MLYRLSKYSIQGKLRESWPPSPQSKERELRVRFEVTSSFPVGLAERFAADVNGVGTALYSWRSGVVVSEPATGCKARAESI